MTCGGWQVESREEGSASTRGQLDVDESKEASEKEGGGFFTYDCTTVDLVCATFLPGIVEYNVEEDVEPSQVTRYFTVPLHVDHEQLVHVLRV